MKNSINISSIVRSWPVVINRKGSGAERFLGKLGNDMPQAWEVVDPGEVEARIGRLRKRGARVVLVGGGDGTVRTAATALIGSDTALAILPLGTTNNIARSLGVPLAPEEALRVYESGQDQHVYAASVNGTVFLNAATMGVSVMVAQHVLDVYKKRFSRAAYAMEAVSRALQADPIKGRIVTGDGRLFQLQTYELVMMNGMYHAGYELPGVVGMWHPSLSLVAFGDDVSKALHVKNMAMWLAGSRRLPEGQLLVQSRSFRIETSKVYAVELDGEILAKTPAEVEIMDQQLLVRLP